MSDKKESKVEAAKRNGRYLRGTIEDTLASSADHFSGDDIQLLKFHGSYQQDDRDRRNELRAQGGHKAYQFMVRMAIPGGRLTAQQYLASDDLASRYASGSLRITTRQGFQLYGVLKKDLKATVAAIHHALLTTLAACGDVERNVMACPAPLSDPAHVILRSMAAEIAEQLRPATRAYHEIWLDGEKIETTQGEEEPFYGLQYLPRKFKTGIALEDDNCVDVYSYDCGLVAVIESGKVRGFNVLIGGGMGMTHRQPSTFAKLAEPTGFVDAEHAVETVRTIAAIFRDHGNREDRRHARLKYLLADWGMERFRDELRARISFRLEAPRPSPRPVHHDHLGRHQQGDGKWFYGIFVENGRIVDTDGVRMKAALRKIVEELRPGIALTGQQNILLTDLPEEDAIERIEATLREHGVRPVEELTAARRYSMACPALPTCGLALAESERQMPEVVDRFEAELESLGLRDTPITLRMTGCPNGCARPYTADIAFVGRGPGVYQVYVGGGLRGDRITDLFASDVPVEDLVTTLRPLLESWATHREPDESLGDYYRRILGRRAERTTVTGLEEPTASIVHLPGESIPGGHP